MPHERRCAEPLFPITRLPERLGGAPHGPFVPAGGLARVSNAPAARGHRPPARRRRPRAAAVAVAVEFTAGFRRGSLLACCLLISSASVSSSSLTSPCSSFLRARATGIRPCSYNNQFLAQRAGRRRRLDDERPRLRPRPARPRRPASRGPRSPLEPQSCFEEPPGSCTYRSVAIKKRTSPFVKALRPCKHFALVEGNSPGCMVTFVFLQCAVVNLERRPLGYTG